jgi:periplasmic protein TonB
MKRKNEKVPEFDEIIFENRNKAYGAYDLRKRYNSVTGFSILGGVFFFAVLTALLASATEEGTASTGPIIVIVEVTDPVIPDNITPPELKPPPELNNIVKNLKPEVVTDTSQISSYLPITDEIIEKIKDGDVPVEEITTENPEQVIVPETKPFISVEEMPEFPGGNSALLKFISENINYPSDAQINNIQGKVILKFVVNADGTVDQIEVIRGIDPSLDNEAIRVIKLLPRFRPGKQSGQPVPVWFSLPVLFRINNN